MNLYQIANYAGLLAWAISLLGCGFLILPDNGRDILVGKILTFTGITLLLLSWIICSIAPK